MAQKTPQHRVNVRPMSQAEIRQVERQVHAKINNYRRSRGLSPLVQDPSLTALAREHSQDMARQRTMSHEGFFNRFKKLRFRGFRGFGENVAMNYGHSDPASVALAGWLKSPRHYENIVDRSRPYTGIGVGVDPNLGGGIYITQLFGRR